MKITIIISEKDKASFSIKNALLKTGVFKNTQEGFKAEIEGKELLLSTIQEDSIYYEEAEEEADSDYYIFPSRHESASGEKTLSVHFPGNFGKAGHGGKDSEFGIAAACLMKEAFKQLCALGKDSGFRCTLEATHHGPYIRKPSFFIEIGSSEKEWEDMKAAEIIANSILGAVRLYLPKSYETALGFGGTHYCPGFNKIELESKIALAHISPRYNIPYLNSRMIEKMVGSTFERPKLALLDWKGLGGKDKEKLIPLLKDLGIKWQKTKEAY